ncbi:hypothetical protein C8R43DRAFT_1238220 [Mycena crocata]|nr:hypothetical protein C8R43DRAFT_1238220 [Mycena crocata]
MLYSASTELDTIRGVLRLSQKYDVDYLHRRALVHISSNYPTALSELNNVLHESSLKSSWPISDFAGFRIAIVQLAREVDALWILPLAFYMLSLSLCLTQTSFMDLFTMVIQLVSLLRIKSRSSVAIRSSVKASRTITVAGRMDCIPLDFWGEEDWEILADVCPGCMATLKKSHEDARQAFWDKLPGIYDLPPWEELEKKKTAAIGNGLAS